MTLKPLTLTFLAAALAAPMTAQAAPIRESKYDVTVEIRMTEDWKATEHKSSSCGPEGARCDEDMNAAGKGELFLRTPTPKRVSVMTGGGMRQPMITYAIDSGIPLKGSYKRSGKVEDIYSGWWDAANEDFIAPTNGCGDHSVKTDVALGWQGRNQLAPVFFIEDVADCPTGPVRGFDYPGDTPSLGAVIAQAGETKFGRTKQFRISGRKTWTGTYPTMNRTDPDDTFTSSGDITTTWEWEATFRKVTKKKRKRRG
jgi:hypothetical protein